MKTIKSILLILTICLGGCAYHPAKLYKGPDMPLADVAVIWDPFEFIRKVDGKSVDPLDSGTVEAIHVLPGRHVFDYYSILEYDFSGITHTKKFAVVPLVANFEAGRTYYCDDIRVDFKPVGFECYQAPEGYIYPSQQDYSVDYDRIQKELEFIKKNGQRIPVEVLRE